MKIFRNFILLLLAALVVYIVAGSSRFSSTGTDRKEREIVLAAARDLAPGVKDPYFSTVILKTWEPLVAISETGGIAPKLAESWTANPDKTVWLFSLKQGVTFQDGESFNARAAVQNFKRYKNMGYKPSPFYGFSIERVYPGLLAAEAVDEYTLRLRFQNPVPMLIYRMAGWGSCMFSPKCFDLKTGNFKTVAAGTGPFRIAGHKDNVYTELERYDGYYGEKARAKRIKVIVIPSPEARYSALKSGEIQGVIDIGSLTPVLTKELLKDKRFACHAAKSTISHYLTLNGRRFPFSDERMRKAVNLAVDREKIVHHYFCDYATPTRSFLNSTNPFTHVYTPRYNPEEARRLAGEVLQGRRVKVRFLLTQYGVARYPYKVISEFIQAELRPLGLDAEIVMVDGMTSQKLLKTGDFDLSIGTRGLPNLDPTWLLSEFFTSKGEINKILGYRNEVIEEAFRKLQHAYSVEERKRIYDQITEELLEYPAVVPLFEDENLGVHNKSLGGYRAVVYGITLDKVHWVKGESEL